MRAAIFLSLLGFSLCVAARADEAADKDCADVAVSRTRTVPGAVINAMRLRKSPPIMGVPKDDTSLTVEVGITSTSINATYV
jgi:hypothetical protein